jgi:toxin ParE1/3/4
MPYRVEFVERAARDLNVLYIEKHTTESPAAARSYNRLEAAVYSLESSPFGCPAAPEAVKSRRPLRHLLYGKKPHVYRVIYEIDEMGQLVTVLAIRRGAMGRAALDE